MGIYKQKDRNGQVRFVVSRYWPQKSGRLRMYAPTHAAARALLARIEHAILEGTWHGLKKELAGQDSDEISVEEFSKRFLDERCKPRMRTWKQYERSLRDANKVLGAISLQEFRRRDLHFYVEKRRKEVSPASVNRDIAAVKAMFSYAVDVEVLEDHPLVRFRLLPEQKKAFTPMTLEEERRLVDSMPNVAIKALVAVLGDTGLRKSEGLYLRWENIDFHKRILSTDQTKNYKARQVPLSEFALSWLGQLVRHFNCPHVFVNSVTGKRWRNPEQAFKRGCKRAGLPHVGFHDLRRFRATQWHSNGVDVRTIQELLGHSSVETTLRYLGLSQHLVKMVRQAQQSEEQELVATPTGNK